jgi:hypothetical protein
MIKAKFSLFKEGGHLIMNVKSLEGILGICITRSVKMKLHTKFKNEKVAYQTTIHLFFIFFVIEEREQKLAFFNNSMCHMSLNY